jgi:hypothetical protein
MSEKKVDVAQIWNCERISNLFDNVASTDDDNFYCRKIVDFSRTEKHHFSCCTER